MQKSLKYFSYTYLLIVTMSLVSSLHDIVNQQLFILNIFLLLLSSYYPHPASNPNMEYQQRCYEFHFSGLLGLQVRNCLCMGLPGQTISVDNEVTSETL